MAVKADLPYEDLLRIQQERQPQRPTASDIGNRYGIASSMDNPLAQEQLSVLNQLASKRRDTAMQGVDASEQLMYRSIGLQQQQLENDIRKRRQQAMKSGMTSAQLAAQELQTLMAAQQGAQMYAEQYAQQRADVENQYAAAEEQNMLSMLQQINNNNLQLANIGTQEYVGELSYKAQALAPLEQANALMEQYPGLTFAEALGWAQSGKAPGSVDANNLGWGDSWNRGLLPWLGDVATTGIGWISGQGDSELFRGVKKELRTGDGGIVVKGKVRKPL